jgi:2-keto-4-pentenoate hydratase/2-oxohepta-3-ene-1,7-dioic acid hydratase in catechol pathway
VRLLTYTKAEGCARLGVIFGELVVDVARLAEARGRALPATMQEFIEQSATSQPALAALLGRFRDQLLPVGCAWPLSDVRVLAPIPRPRKNIFGIGLNYRAHVQESARSLSTSADAPERPVVFTKPPTAVIGPGEGIRHDARLTRQLDWEVELAVVVGRTARRVSAAAAAAFVFGYSVIVDISARDNRRGGQWLISKGMDTYAPLGPCIVTADEIPDPQNLRLWLKKNGEMKQDGNTSQMIFAVANLIEDLSAGITLEPGDIIATGTPEGVGAGRTPQEWLWPGDMIEAGVDGIGVLRNPVVAA